MFAAFIVPAAADDAPDVAAVRHVLMASFAKKAGHGPLRFAAATR
ncbi:hypothetical protein [Methylocella silvestris]|nr:hypothetical protein [Methylocella silvestris]